MVAAAKIDRSAYYDEMSLWRTLGIRSGSLSRARKSGELRFTRRGGMTLYRGDWVEDWLIGAEQTEPAAAPESVEV